MSFTTTLTVTATGADALKLLQAMAMVGLEPEAAVSETEKEIIEVKELPVKAVSDFNKTDPKSEPSKKTKKRKFWLTKTVKRELRKLAKNGKTIGQASKITGVPYHSIYLWKEVKTGRVKFAKGKGGRRKKTPPKYK
tara:strand:+ start:405 stop:815 length:411 start_codon:yes stop_codon:yes gene_type:complete